jgi:hypothetical protein
MKILLALLLSINSFAQLPGLVATSSSAVSKPVINLQQDAFDYIASQADFFLSPIPTSSGQGGAFTDTGLTTRVVDGDEILGFKGFGLSPPSIVNLPFNGALIDKSDALVWYNALGNGTHIAARYADRGNFDKYAVFHNGPIAASYYETQPGSTTSITHPIDIIFALRHTPNVSNETMHNWKDDNVIRFNSNTALTSSTPYSEFIDCVVRVRILSDGTWVMWKNGTQIASGSGTTFSTIEWILGTSSHVSAHHFRYIMYKYGAFTDEQVTLIYAKSQICFPWTVPAYPFKSNMWQSGNTAFDNSINGWRAGYGRTPVFTGGNGVEGTHTFQWFYFDSNDDDLFPSSDGLLTNHRQIPGTINLSTMDDGDVVTLVEMDGVDITDTPITYTTSTSNTAALLVAEINSTQDNFLAVQRGSVVRIHALDNNYRPDVVTATVTGFTPTIISTPRVGYINCTTYNATGQIYDGHLSDASIWVAWVMTPKDSNGTAGEPFLSQWVSRNF